jgi:rhodanese-related sulfurtransferase
MKKKLLNKKDVLIWICSTCVRVFGASGTLSAYMGKVSWAIAGGLIAGAAYELKLILEKQTPTI